jgi:hypothetical protein
MAKHQACKENTHSTCKGPFEAVSMNEEQERRGEQTMKDQQ